MCNYSGCRTWRDECCEAWKPKEETHEKDMVNIIRCKDCINKECFGRDGKIVCDLDGFPHDPDWFCADGERK